MEKILYLECYSGISGDMTVGALLDLGADPEVLKKALSSLNIGGYHLHFGRKKKCGIDAYDFDVHVEDECHDHEKAHAHTHGEDHHHTHGEEHTHEGEDHTHGEHHHHAHGEEFHQSYEKENHHIHRNLADIVTIIDRLQSTSRVKDMARTMFQIVADAEAKAHGIPVEEVHFHEVGAIDSIIDIISVAVCLNNLGIDQVVVSPLAEGQGYVRCQHGVIPVPVPATVHIASAYGLTLKLTDHEGEMVTPTGAAIAACLNTGLKLPPQYKISKIGIGAGNKDFTNANILRAMIIVPIEEPAQETIPDRMWVLETNIDDCSGEALGFAMERLLEAGAADVWYSSIYMKKNRPAYTLHILCRENIIDEMEELTFLHTTTIGIRKYPVQRTILDRRNETFITKYGEANVKICSRKNQINCYPEYDSVKEICLRTGENYQTIYQEIKSCGNHIFKG